MSIYKNGQKVLGSFNDVTGFVEKSDITTTIDSSSTDTEVPSTKAVYYNVIKDKLGNLTLDYTYKDSDSMNITLEHFGAYKFSSPTKGVPSYNVGDWVLINIPWGVNNNVTSMRYANQLLFSPRFEGFWHRTVWNYDSSAYTYAEGDYSVFRKWQRISTTSVADVNKTNVTYNTGQSNYVALSGSGINFYSVTNGICQCCIYYQANVATPEGQWANIITGLPKPKNEFYVSISPYIGSGTVCQGCLTQNGTFIVSGGTNSINYMYTFTYPVAES